MKKVCANCGSTFEPDQDFYSLCGRGEKDCWNTVGRSGDEIGLKLWNAVGTLVNLKLEEPDLEALSDSPAFLKLMEKVLENKDLDMRFKWLKREVDKLK